MRRISLLLVSLIVLTVQTTLAQTFSVKGTVMSADDNEPLIGATILQEGTTNGVVTDVDGNYTIEVKDASKATLVISYIGYGDSETSCQCTDENAEHYAYF